MSAAADRLARSRAALVAAMSSPDAGESAQRGGPGRAAHPHDEQDGAEHEGLFESLLGRVRRAWEAHPAHLAVELAGPLLSRWATRHPERLLALAALAGAALVFARPWRLLPAGALGALAWRAGLRAGSRALGLPAWLMPIVTRMRRPVAAPRPDPRHAGLP